MDRTRNMPHQDLIPEGLSDPDWGRVGIRGPGQLAAPGLGDPVRWGASLSTSMAPALFPGRQTFRSGQIVSAQCTDAYPRNWSVIGTLSWHAFINALPNGGGNDQWAAVLSVSMGTGQAQLVHNLDLRAICAADDPFYHGSDNTFGGLIGLTAILDQPFVAPGALLGSTISIQFALVVNIVAAPPAIPLPFTCNVQISPMAPGQGL